MKNVKMKPNKPEVKPMVHPNSLKNLKRTAGPGRPKTGKRAITAKAPLKAQLNTYLQDGSGSTDFEKIRIDNPRWSLEFAADRIWGKPAQPKEGDGKPGANSVAVLIQVLCGREIPQEAKEKMLEDAKPLDSLPSPTEEEPQENAKI
jgi:hypothetical protein